MAYFLSKVFASGFGAGYFPYAPGTAGTIVGCFLLWPLHVLSPKFFPGSLLYPFPFIALIIVFFIIGVLAGNKLESIWGKDSSKIVIDEIVGIWISLFTIPFSWPYVLTGLLVFRVFDIIKPLYIKRAEQLKGGWGVMLDDVVAGIYTNVILQVVLAVSG